ncbi:hypothetical protein [Caloramator australicus]|jgi:hypothetical protein|uniref:Uncharacterized protein n=1 Tax=Caloramator australicus RC3 TaxID=857293 RepID=I7LH97_9CLOT|nr:hypothetical protein [Caloramator australicus]CCJ33856.1 hypothetical protein CAAU_1772 [Caloramator australicus RC3]
MTCPRKKDVDLQNIDDKELDIYTPDGLDYPIIEKTNNALLWPDSPKSGIDIEDFLDETNVPEHPNKPLKDMDMPF